MKRLNHLLFAAMCAVMLYSGHRALVAFAESYAVAITDASPAMAMGEPSWPR